MKLTVFGVVVVTSNVPAVSVIVPPTPNPALVPNCNFVPFNVTLNKFARPDNVDVPLNETVPAVAVKEPPTERSEVRVKLVELVTLPVTLRLLIVIVPEPELLIVLEAPLMVIVPAVAESEPVPDALRLPDTVTDVVVLVDPVRLRLLNEIPLPMMLFDTPLIVVVPPEA